MAVAAGRLLFSNQLVIGLAGYQLTAALLSQLDLNQVRRALVSPRNEELAITNMTFRVEVHSFFLYASLME